MFGIGRTIPATLTSLAGISAMMMLGCRPADPVAYYIEEMEKAPPEQRPRDWDRTRNLMSRTAPRVGDPAPDFMLPLADGNGIITRSTYQGNRPLFLIFGSYT